MTTLSQLIARLGLTGTAADIAAALNAKTERLPRSEQLTYAAVAKELGADFVAPIDAKLGAAGLEWLRRQLSGAGIDFSDPITIATIDGLVSAGVFTAAEAEAVKSLGFRSLSPYEMAFGEGLTVSEEQVAAALAPKSRTGTTRLLSVYSTDAVVQLAYKEDAVYSDGSKENVHTINYPQTQDAAERAWAEAILSTMNEMAHG